MKRFFAVLCAITMFIPSLAIFPTSACELPQILKSTHYPDGSYIITVISEEDTFSPQLFTSYTKNGSKTTTAYSATGNVLYSLTVHGTFSYDGTSAYAIRSAYSYTDESPLWTFTSGSSSCSSACATALGTFKAGSISKSVSVSLTCSANGTLS